jgi:diacylglycerol kinase family enzyme
VVEATSRLTLAFRAYGLRRRALESQRGVRSFRPRRVELEVPDDMPYNVDGDLVMGGAVELLAVRRAFDVVVG